MEERMEIGKLSSNQVKYLAILDEYEQKKMLQKRGIVQMIADQCGVKHALKISQKGFWKVWIITP